MLDDPDAHVGAMTRPVTSVAEERLIGGYSGRMLGVLTVGLGAAKFTRRVIPPLLPTILTDLAISPFEAGVALSVATLFFALLQFPGGQLADQLTRKTVVMAGLVGLLVGGAILASTWTYALLLLGVAVVGAGEGVYGPSDRALLSDLFSKRRGQAFGLHTMASDISGILAAGFAVVVLATTTWRVAFLPVVLVAGGLLLVVYVVGREPIVLSGATFEIRETVGRLFGERRFRALVFVYCLFAFTQQGVLGFLPTLLRADYSFSTEVASGLFATVFLVGAVARPLAGWLSDRISRAHIGGGGLLLSGCGISLLLAAPTPLVALAGVMVFAGGQMAFPPVMQAYLMDVFPDASMGGDLGATRTVYLAVGSLGPAYVGFVAGSASYTLAFGGLVVCLFLAGGLLLWMARRA